MPERAIDAARSGSHAGWPMGRLQLRHIAGGTPFRDPTVAIGTAAIGKI